MSARRRRYVAVAERSGRWWAVRVPGVPGAFTQARTLRGARFMARDVVALMLDIDRADVEVTVVTEPPGRRRFRWARRRRIFRER